MRVLSGEEIISSRSIQHRWVGKDIQMDISKCMLVTPRTENSIFEHYYFSFNTYCRNFQKKNPDHDNCFRQRQVGVVRMGPKKKTINNPRTRECIRCMGRVRQDQTTPKHRSKYVCRNIFRRMGSRLGKLGHSLHNGFHSGKNPTTQVSKKNFF